MTDFTVRATSSVCNLWITLCIWTTFYLSANNNHYYCADGFSLTGAPPKPSSWRLRMAVTPEESAKALSDYMAKAHVEKLTAIQRVKDEKDAKIKELEEKLEKQSSSSTSSIAPTTAITPVASSSSATVEELTAKLEAYQKFMAEYIVRSTDQRCRAIKEAEETVAKRYEEKLLLLGAGGTAAADTSTAVEMPSPSKTPSSLYDKRNVKVTAAAAAGKSRWGDAEVAKAATAAVSVSTAVAVPPAPVELGPIPEEVVNADHGLRADGGVGGPTLAERVLLGTALPLNGASPSVALVVPTTSKDDTFYEKRNARVMAAAKAGKNSRWGELELNNIVKYGETKQALLLNGASNGVAAPAPVKANGATALPSLEDRVNLGAKIALGK